MASSLAPQNACSASCLCSKWRGNWFASYWDIGMGWHCRRRFSRSNLLEGWKLFYWFCRYTYCSVGVLYYLKKQKLNNRPISSFIFGAALFWLVGNNQVLKLVTCWHWLFRLLGREKRKRFLRLDIGKYDKSVNIILILYKRYFTVHL